MVEVRVELRLVTIALERLDYTYFVTNWTC